MSKPSVTQRSAMGLGTATAESESPGSAWIRASSTSEKVAHCCGVEYWNRGSEMSAFTTCWTSNPGLTDMSLAKLRSSRPAATSRTIASAIFSCRQEAARTAAAARFARARAAFAKARLQIGIRGEQGRGQAEATARDGGKEQGEAQDPQVHANLVHARQARREERAQALDAPVSEGHPRHPAEQAEHRGFAQQLADDPSSPGTERRPNGDLSRAGSCARQEQVGDVGASDQEHEADGAQQHEKRGPSRLQRSSAGAAPCGWPSPSFSAGNASASRAAMASSSASSLRQ